MDQHLALLLVVVIDKMVLKIKNKYEVGLN
jgi:hypothetical protein